MATGALVGLTAAGTYLQMEGNTQAARAKEKAVLEEANMKRVQANQMLERFELNAKVTRMKGREFQSTQISAFAKGGIDVGSGATLLALEDTNRSVQSYLDIQRTEVEDQAAALRAGATLDEVLAKDIRKAAKLTNTGLFLSGAGQSAAMAGK